MNNTYYQTIFKRKSFHLFRNLGLETIEDKELDEIKEVYHSFEKLYPEIKTDIRIVPSEQVDFKRGAQYCILIYSEKKENYLMNAGYIGEQLDLYLVDHNIATLWFGIGKCDIQNYEGMDFVIMIAIHKVSDQTKYRKEMFKSKRKPLEDIWKGDILDFANIIRFSPSACNTQPWFVEHENNSLIVYRYKQLGKRGIMPAEKVVYYNRIDIGIFLCILEICMAQHSISWNRTLFIDNTESEYVEVAKYDFQ